MRENVNRRFGFRILHFGTCRAFPDPQRNDLATGPKWNFQILALQNVPATNGTAVSGART